MTLTKHYRAWLLSAGFFLLLAMAMVGPLIFNAMADLSSAEQAAIQARNAAINEAILNRDYNAWSSLNPDKSLVKNINADNFAAFAEAYSLLQQGKVE
ncbi:hypothetical protein EOM82_09770, partial [bacterium]|nr:hypothetical protein [bacterium]